MELINSTRMVAGYAMGMEPSGRELLVVVVKGTFVLPRNDEPVRLAEEQIPLVMADTFTGEPGFSAPVYEADYSPGKPRCDVLLLGSAYAERGRPAPRVEVGVRVGTMTKSFTVVGHRLWRCGVSRISSSSPEPFTVMPISYDFAFGGVDDRHDDPKKHAAFARNPVGRGFHKHLRPEWIDGTALPNTEEPDRPIESPDSTGYIPMSLGPLGRGWEPRHRYAGTYDDEWLDEHFPFLPPDFDERYYQSAPIDQQISHPLGGEVIRLINLTPDGEASFRLPIFDAPIHFFPKRAAREDGALTLDTIIIEPDVNRFILTWRATRPLKRNMFEVAQVMVGKRSHDWWSARSDVSFPLRLLFGAPQPGADESRD